MKFKIATLQLLTIFLCSCATHYNEPNPAKVIESTKKVKETITHAHENSKKVTQDLKTAQQASDSITLLSNTIMGKINELLDLVPPQFQPPLIDIKTDVTNMQTQEVVLDASLEHAYLVQTDQDATLQQAKLHEAELEKNQLDYRQEVLEIVKNANTDSENLAWYRRKWFMGWIILGASIIALVIFWGLKAGFKLYFWK